MPHHLNSDAYECNSHCPYPVSIETLPRQLVWHNQQAKTTLGLILIQSKLNLHFLFQINPLDNMVTLSRLKDMSAFSETASLFPLHTPTHNVYYQLDGSINSWYTVYYIFIYIYIRICCIMDLLNSFVSSLYLAFINNLSQKNTNLTI